MYDLYVWTLCIVLIWCFWLNKENILYNKDCVFTVYYHANSGNITDISDLITISPDIECKTDPNPIIVDSKIIDISELKFIIQ